MALFELLANTRSPEQKLVDAVSSDNIEQLQRLLEEGIDPDKKLNKFGGDRAIHLAATKGSTLVIEHLINAGANCELPNDLGVTPLYNAVRANHPLAVKALLMHCTCDTHLKFLWIEGVYVESKIPESCAMQTLQIVAAPNLLFQKHHLRPTYWDVFFTRSLSDMTNLMNSENIRLLFLTGFKNPNSVFLTYEKKIVEKHKNLENSVLWTDLSDEEQNKVINRLLEIIAMLQFMKRNPPSLSHLCRLTIRWSFWNNCNAYYGASQLPLPTDLKKFIVFNDEF